MIFQPAHSSLRSQVAGASPGSSGRKAGPHPHQHSVRLGQLGHAGSPHMYLSQTWEEERPQRKPTQTGRTCRLLHTDSGPGQESILFLIDVIMKQCYSRTCYLFYTLNN